MPPIFAIAIVALMGIASFYIGSIIIGAVAWLILKPVAFIAKLVRKLVEGER